MLNRIRPQLISTLNVLKITRSEAPGKTRGQTKTMKRPASRINTMSQPARGMGHPQRVALATVAMLLFTNFAYAELDKAKSKCEPCIETARLMHSSSLHEAAADYYVGLAKANNEPAATERIAAKKQAVDAYKSARELAKQQLRERHELCEELDEDRYSPVINPAEFLSVAETAAGPNPLFPLVPGTTYNFRSVTPEGTETVEFAVTRDTRAIQGVTCIVVRDIVRLNGSVTEDTVDWFAQDRRGNVWYFGENTAEYEDGLITSTAGSWEADVSGAKPGIIMFGRPVVGKVYRQELFLGEAEDAAEVLALSEMVEVPAGTYSNCLKTEDFTPISPNNTEIKYYAPGVGNVLTLTPATGKRVELISVTHN